MPAGRGSQHKLIALKEATFGTTPADSTAWAEQPIVSLSKEVNNGLIRSAQIRTHPFTDRVMNGMQTQDLEISTELQDDTHDVLLQALFGADFATNAVKVTDALYGLSLESRHQDLTLYDQFAGCVVRRGEFTFNGDEDAVVTANYGVMAKTSTLDAASSLVGTGSITAAPSADPFIFSGGTVTINAVARPVSSVSFTLERTLDTLRVLGSATPREYIPSEVTLTGTLTIPYEDNVESTRLEGFTNAPLVIKAADASGSNWRQWTIPNTRYSRMRKSIQGRGIVVQEIDWEALYDTSSTTIATLTRSA